MLHAPRRPRSRCGLCRFIRQHTRHPGRGAGAERADAGEAVRSRSGAPLPVLGSGHLFHAYFKLKDECPRCRLRFQRLDGQWSGDIGIHTVVTFGLLYVTLMVGVVAFYGHINVVALSVIGGFIVVIFPALFVPFAKTLWLAIDLMMRPAEATEFTPSAERAEAPAEDEA